jgi:hypothetical protein
MENLLKSILAMPRVKNVVFLKDCCQIWAIDPASRSGLFPHIGIAKNPIDQLKSAVEKMKKSGHEIPEM